MEGVMARRLSDKQVAILAALDRLGDATRLDLRAELPHLAPSEVRRVLGSLERRGLVVSEGDEERVYLGGVVFSAAEGPLEDEEDYEPLAEPARTALRRITAMNDWHRARQGCG